MSDLKTLKDAFDEVGVYYKESMEGEYTYISPCNKRDAHRQVNTAGDAFFEFNEDGAIASY